MSILKIGDALVGIGGAASYSAGDNIDITNNVISVTGLGEYQKTADMTGYPTMDTFTGAMDSLSEDIDDVYNTMEARKQDKSAMTAYQTIAGMTGYQSALSAGPGIDINNNVISVTGEFGKTYTGIAPVVVDNTANTIAVTGLDQFQKTADMTGYPTMDTFTGAMDSLSEDIDDVYNTMEARKQDKSAMTAYQTTAGMTGYVTVSQYNTLYNSFTALQSVVNGITAGGYKLSAGTGIQITNDSSKKVTTISVL